MKKQFGALLLALLLAVSPVWAEELLFFPSNSALSLTARVEALYPYNEETINAIDRLISQCKLTIAAENQIFAAEFSLAGNPLFSLVQSEENGVFTLRTDLLDSQLQSASASPLSLLFPTESENTLWDIADSMTAAFPFLKDNLIQLYRQIPVKGRAWVENHYFSSGIAHSDNYIYYGVPVQQGNDFKEAFADLFLACLPDDWREAATPASITSRWNYSRYLRGSEEMGVSAEGSVTMPDGSKHKCAFTFVWDDDAVILTLDATSSGEKLSFSLSEISEDGRFVRALSLSGKGIETGCRVETTGSDWTVAMTDEGITRSFTFADGMLDVSVTKGSIELARFAIAVSEADGIAPQLLLSDDSADADKLSEDELLALRKDAENRFASRLMKALLTLPAEDLSFLTMYIGTEGLTILQNAMEK